MKSHFKILNGLIIFLLVTAVHAKADNNLVKDMVHFDQVYIPVLAFTSDEKVKASKVAMAKLVPVWKSFYNRYYTHQGDDSQWKNDFDKVGQYVKTSQDIIQRGTDIKEAHEQLEHVRVVFMQLRERNHIDYFVDHLTRFHEPMEKIVLAVKDKTETTLTDKDINTVKSSLPEAKELWHAVVNSRFDASLYEFNKQQTAKLHELVDKEKTTLENLQKAITKGNKNEIIKTGLAIKPNFANFFKAFGHFPKME